MFAGRTSGEEEDAQGPSQEENNIHSTIRERHNDWRKEKGEFQLRNKLAKKVLTNWEDEPQPNHIMYES